jgi:hypothetical protein
MAMRNLCLSARLPGLPSEVCGALVLIALSIYRISYYKSRRSHKPYPIYCQSVIRPACHRVRLSERGGGRKATWRSSKLKGEKAAGSLL